MSVPRVLAVAVIASALCVLLNRQEHYACLLQALAIHALVFHLRRSGGRILKGGERSALYSALREESGGRGLKEREMHPHHLDAQMYEASSKHITQ